MLPSFAALGEADNEDILSLLFDFGDGTLEIARQAIAVAIEEPDGVEIQTEGLCLSIKLCPSEDWRLG